MPERYWDAVHEKLAREGGACRVCGTTFFVQRAHVVGRKHDQVVELEDGSTVLYVDPVDVIPLCEAHHRAYDARELSVLEYLTYAEQAAAVQRLGIVRALHRLTGERDYALPLDTRRTEG